MLELAPLLATPNPVKVAQSLLGVMIVTQINGRETVGKITETEAYWAPEDQASHAKNHRKTARTATFYTPAGTAYVYLCYGIHELFNVVTGASTDPHAVLIRAVEPVSGMDTMVQRRVMKTIKPQLTAGPGVLSKALGISR
ncbi:MAG: DNA-3-methyladenine glycosylase, partial [Bacteroidota bacterium]